MCVVQIILNMYNIYAKYKMLIKILKAGILKYRIDYFMNNK